MRYILSALIVVIVIFLTQPVAGQVNVTTRNINTNIIMLWESTSYVPPFYKGKALMPDGGDGRVIAVLPAGIEQTEDTTYTWRIDGEVDGTRSGIGRSAYEIRSDIFGGSPLIVVEVSNAEGVVGTGALRIPLSAPQAMIYAEAPLGGVLFNIESPRLSSEELVIETYPLFFTTPRRDDIDMSYQWEINRTIVDNPLGDSGRLIVRGEPSVGTTTVGVTILNDSRIFERAVGETALFFE